MATRIINSPGVSINERDLSLVAPNNVGTTVFVTGFTDQGPTDEVIKISTRDELELVYGTPKNSAERYFYHTVEELLNSPANIYTSRMPYGTDSGTGFSTKYSALVYPVQAVQALSGYEVTLASSTTNVLLSADKFGLVLSDNKTYTFGFSSTTVAPAVLTYNDYVIYSGSPVLSTTLIDGLSAAIARKDSTATFALASNVLSVKLAGTVGSYDIDTLSFPTGNTLVPANGTATLALSSVTRGTFFIGKPQHLELTEDQYISILDGSALQWSPTASNRNQLSALSNIGGAGVVVLNKGQTAISDQFEGYYVGLCDNANINPGTNFQNIVGVTSIDDNNTYVTVPEGTLQFNLSAEYHNGPTNSISEIMEKLADYDITGASDNDLLSLGVFKLRKSIFATESFKLDYVVEDKLTGSINYFKTITDKNGGAPINNFLESTDSNSRNVTVLVNDYVSGRLGLNTIQPNGDAGKRIRVLTRELVSQASPAKLGALTSVASTVVGSLDYADNLYGLGVYTGVAVTDKVLGDIPSKLDRVLDGVRNDDIYELDVVVEAGLGTIYAAASGASTGYYDEFLFNSTLATQVSGLRTSGAIGTSGETLRNNYNTIFNKFANFCSPAYEGGGRGDCIFVADVLRHIVVTGKDNKVMASKNSIFQKDIYWPMRHQFETQNTSYACVYGQWAKVYDSFIGQQVWAPFSGFAAAVMARTDAARFPWIAPAGFNNGLIHCNDLAVNPNQKQRDEMYKVNINAVSFFPSHGQVVFGQKTLSKKPSAFDRINVRRLFLALERPCKKASYFFVFEPNSTFTRTRLLNTLTPVFDRAKNNEGLEQFILVCDERNNTPQVIDNNELVVDIYISPTKASEFILLNFTATRTGVNFQEIVGA